MKSFDIWVKVIRANPLKGPCEGQVQFLVDWERRKAVHRDWVWFNFGGKRHKTALVGGYATVYSNFSFSEKEQIMRYKDKDLQIAMWVGQDESWRKVFEEQPPKMRRFQVFFGNSNDRICVASKMHWDATKLRDEIAPKYLGRLRNAERDGDEHNAYVSVYTRLECFTVYVEAEYEPKHTTSEVEHAPAPDRDANGPNDTWGDPDRLNDRFRDADGPELE